MGPESLHSYQCPVNAGTAGLGTTRKIAETTVFPWAGSRESVSVAGEGVLMRRERYGGRGGQVGV